MNEKRCGKKYGKCKQILDHVTPSTFGEDEDGNKIEIENFEHLVVCATCTQYTKE